MIVLFNYDPQDYYHWNSPVVVVVVAVFVEGIPNDFIVISYGVSLQYNYPSNLPVVVAVFTEEEPNDCIV